MAPELPVIIVGGGIVGLTLAQALKQAKVPFEVYERDPYLDVTKGGWGITIHWALAALKQCLPTALYDAVKTVQVDPQQGRKDTGRFIFLNIADAKPRFIIPPSPRLRINRGKFRALLAKDIDIHWDKNISGCRTGPDGSVEVDFADGTTCKGSVLVGADGSSSRVRRLLMGEDAGRLNQLPLRFMGVTVRMTAAQVRPLREIDPLLFQGSHPETGVFMWYSTLSTPEVNGSAEPNQYYEGQLNLSWPVKSPADEVPEADRDRVVKMKAMAKDFEPQLRKAIEDIPNDSKVLEIKLQDWPTLAWPNPEGNMTLAGDAAHAMTMYRGEAANHGITDAAKLSEQLIAMYDGKLSRKKIIDAYEAEMRSRAHEAVLLSRQACVDAHDLNNITASSPLVSKRAKVQTPGAVAVA